MKYRLYVGETVIQAAGSAQKHFPDQNQAKGTGNESLMSPN